MTQSGILSRKSEHFETGFLGRAVISVRPYFHSPQPIIARGCCWIALTVARDAWTYSGTYTQQPFRMFDFIRLSPASIPTGLL